MDKRVRWGIAGPGRMAATMAAEFAHSPSNQLVAVASRDHGRAMDFAAEHRIPTTYGSYAELCADRNIDAIFVATPHPQHADIALEAIAHGKAVLVEKAFTDSVASSKRVISAARAAKVFCMEGVWTRFLPAVVKAREVIASGELGQVRAVQGDLTAFRTFDPTDRIFDRAQGGGAMLDVGVYALSFAQMFLGDPSSVHAVGGRLPNGVDGEFGLVLGYPDGRLATLQGGFTAQGPGRMMIACTNGWIDVLPRFHRASTIIVWRGKHAEELSFPSEGAGYFHELEHVAACLRDGLTESPIMPLRDTLIVQEIMQKALTQIP